MHDVLENVPNLQINCLDKGFVRLLDVMPRLISDDQKTADYIIAETARVSYGDGTKSISENNTLIRYLLRNNHSSPIEMINFKFMCKAPICCVRQIFRHRMQSINEMSARYSIMKDEFYIPELKDVHQQSTSNKQGGEQFFEGAEEFIEDLNDICSDSYDLYLKLIEKGLSREQARMLLPVNLYTQWIFNMNLHNLLHFLSLRCDKHTQFETRVFADAILELIRPIVPVTIEAWEDYHPMRGAVKLTRLEVEAIQKVISEAKRDGNLVQDLLKIPQINTQNKREQNEWIEKAKKLGF